MWITIWYECMWQVLHSRSVKYVCRSHFPCVAQPKPHQKEVFLRSFLRYSRIFQSTAKNCLHFFHYSLPLNLRFLSIGISAAASLGCNPSVLHTRAEYVRPAEPSLASSVERVWAKWAQWNFTLCRFCMSQIEGECERQGKKEEEKGEEEEMEEKE